MQCTTELRVSDGLGNTIAMVDVIERSAWPNSGVNHWVTNLWVHPDHRRKGLGRKMLQAAIERFGHKPLFLSVSPYSDQPMEAGQLYELYSSFGFANRGDGIMRREGGDRLEEGHEEGRQENHLRALDVI